MTAAMTITGSQDVLDSIFERVRAIEGVEIDYDRFGTVRGFSVSGVRALLSELDPNQREILVAIVEAGGYISAARLGERVGRTSFQGVFGPISKAINRLAARGVLGADASKPIRTITIDGQTDGFRIDDDLIEIFTEAVRIMKKSASIKRALRKRRTAA